MPKWSRYAASSASSVSSRCSVRVPPRMVWMSIRPLMETRPLGVSREQIVLRVKCDSGDVCDPAHLRAEGLEQQRECPVELVAEAAAATAHDLVDQVGLIQGDGLGQVNAQVLERHRQLMR